MASHGDAMQGAYLGPAYDDETILACLESHNAAYERLDDDTLSDRVAGILAEDKVVGWFQGRMEFGPRALGNRSILGDARSPAMQRMLNLKIKYRESFDRSHRASPAKMWANISILIPTALTC